MKRVLLVSPHFPPDSGAASHRMRLLAPHLSAWGWSPTVLTVEAEAYEGRLDPTLAALVPRDVPVVRAPAWPARWTRRLGVGDLGLRAYTGLRRVGRSLLRSQRFDAVVITIFPAYPALLARPFAAVSGAPVVLDYQDPWVGAWGATAGPGPGGRPNMRSRMSRAVAVRLEPRALRHVAGLMAVSEGTRAGIVARLPWVADLPFAEVPLGGEPADYTAAPAGVPEQLFAPGDGLVHVVHAGTVLPLAREPWRALFLALAALRRESPQLANRLRVHLVGTSNTTNRSAAPLAWPLADAAGVGDLVSEVPARLDYLDALRAQREASALLVVGSTEPHYTASKLFPALLAQRPVVAFVHEASSVASLTRAAMRPPSGRVVTFTDAASLAATGPDLVEAWRALAEGLRWDASACDPAAVQGVSARAMAGRVAQLLDRVAGADA